MRTRHVAVLLFVALIGVLASAQSQAMAQTPQATAAEITAEIDGDYGLSWTNFVYELNLPPAVYSADTPGAQVDQIIIILHWFMLALFVGWGIYFVYCLVKFRARPGHKATHEHVKAKAAKYIEVGVAVFEGVLLVFLAIPAWGSVKTDFPTDAENPQHVHVIAEQFAWNFHYPGPDGVFGKLDPHKIDLAINPIGIDENDPAGADDITSPELHIVKERPVIAQLGSKDVIHSFWLPVLRVKQDVIPGMRIPVWFKARKSGNYEVACAQLCGNNHYSMKALMTIHETQSGLDEWIADQAPEEFDEDEFD